ncbi:FAD:protein FMN transferase [candidate division FCPU426 bacterium]|nr:FAD:protein FMN transferase [candidate division FCPU426 bacterium]
MVKSMLTGLAIAAAAGAALYLGWRAVYRVQVTQTQSMLGTQVTVTVLAQELNQGRKTVESIFTEIRRLEKIYSDRLEDSELSRINLSAGQGWVLVSGEMAEVLDMAFYWHERSGGLFDITVGVLGQAWGFKTRAAGSMPDARRLKDLVIKGGMDKIQWETEERRLRFTNSAVKLDLGGIAKVAILCRLDDFLKEKRCFQYLVNLGGDVLAGQRGVIRKWRIGISDPFQPDEIIAQLELEDYLVLTSGDYHRFFQQQGKKYHHILDPRTGFPRETVNAVTVVMPTLLPDPPPSIVVFLLGQEEGMKLVESIPAAECVIFKDQARYCSSGFQALLSQTGLRGQWPGKGGHGRQDQK